MSGLPAGIGIAAWRHGADGARDGRPEASGAIAPEAGVCDRGGTAAGSGAEGAALVGAGAVVCRSRPGCGGGVFLAAEPAVTTAGCRPARPGRTTAVRIAAGARSRFHADRERCDASDAGSGQNSPATAGESNLCSRPVEPDLSRQQYAPGSGTKGLRTLADSDPGGSDPR